ncbi:MAG: class I SAM-dependent methyltransferase [Thiotrichaceae bacterium]|nr:class I SAM-dependent methyltransferase [Thiotrichaceae bacterium]
MIATCNCRFCQTPLKHSFADLGMSPLSNAFLTVEQLNQAEKFYPLHAYVCENCFLVQLEAFETPDAIFSDYVYFSSYSTSWLNHAQQYTNSMIENYQFNLQHLVIEIASNDGYLLQYFKQYHIPVLGIEPAKNVAQVALEKGIPTETAFFGVETAKNLVARGQSANLLIANNVLAHVPDINDFVAGLKLLLKPQGIITIEFPHLLNLIVQNQFDTIYHEHFSYLSLLAVENIFAQHGLMLFDVEELATHGGSLRIYACHQGMQSINPRIFALRAKEKAANLGKLERYTQFLNQVTALKRDLLHCLIEIKNQNKQIAAYGAAAKGNTLLNYCGIRQDFIEYVADLNPHKQNKYLPGTHIPVCSPEQLKITQPAYVLILPWNLQIEIMQQLAFIREWGGQFIIPIPDVQIL